MPAAAVIPAPIAYIKVVAVKKLVVESLSSPTGSLWGTVGGFLLGVSPSSARRRGRFVIVYCEQIRVFQTG